MKGITRNKAARPTKEVKGKTTNLTLAFALAGDMITQQEYHAALVGYAVIERGCKDIFNVNAAFHNFPTGTRQTLYPGRGTIISNKAFLEFEG